MHLRKRINSVSIPLIQFSSPCVHPLGVLNQIIHSRFFWFRWHFRFRKCIKRQDQYWMRISSVSPKAEKRFHLEGWRFLFVFLLMDSPLHPSNETVLPTLSHFNYSVDFTNCCTNHLHSAFSFFLSTLLFPSLALPHTPSSLSLSSVIAATGISDCWPITKGDKHTSNL